MKTKGRLYKSVIVGLVVVVTFTGVFAYMHFSKDDFNANAIEISQMDKDEIAELLNQQVEEGKINVQYQMNSVFCGRVSEDFLVRNIENNHHPIVFKIYDEDEHMIYKSHELDRGYEIKDITLDKALPKGKHNCKIEISYVTDGNVKSRFPLTVNVI